MDFGFPGNIGDKNLQTSKHLNYVSISYYRIKKSLGGDNGASKLFG